MRSNNITLEKVGPANLSDCGIGCLKNRKNEAFQRKVQWLRQRFNEGLRCLLFRDGDGNPLGFLEYVPGEYAWRPVDAAGWLFVHCLWVNPKGQKIGGLGSRLIQACLEQARQADALGVAAMVSDGPWMAGKEVFLKNGFQVLGTADRFQMVACRLKDGPEPRFRILASNGSRWPGLQVLFCDQCPMLSRSVHDLSEVVAEYGLKLRVTELKNAREAQCAPSYYGVFNLLWDGRVLADHYVSKTRFRNILRDEVFLRSH
jgi:hypothetical protein